MMAFKNLVIVIVLMLAVTIEACTNATISRLKLSPKGPEVSRIALGTLHLMELKTPQATLQLIQGALSVGITTFDLSDVYGGHQACTTLFGGALRMAPGLRERIEIVAKMNVAYPNGYDSSTEHLEAVLAEYLSILNTEYLDLVMLHRQDYLTDPGMVGALFKKWQSQGKVRYFGVSNHDQNSFSHLNQYVNLVTNEIEVSVWTPETLAPLGSPPIADNGYLTNNGLVDFHYRMGMSVLAWGPLGGDPYGGTNRLFVKTGDRQTKIRSELQSVAEELGSKEDIVALAWVLRHPAKIVPIIGTTQVQRLRSQACAEEVAQNMSGAQWYHIAMANGIPLP